MERLNMTKMRGHILLLLALIFLSSCAMGPDYSRPDMVIPDSFRMKEETATGPSIANLAWWELLEDEELQRLIHIALRENRDLQRAVASIEEFQARAFIARTDYIPQLSATVNIPAVRRGGARIEGFPTPFTHSMQGNLSWELDIWGRIRRSNEAALGDLLAQEENRRAVILELVSGVAQSYFDLLQFDMQLDIARRTLRSWEESVSIAQARLDQGLSSQLDYDQFEAERANAQARVAELQRLMVQKENELSVLLGKKSRFHSSRSLAHRTGDAARGTARTSLRAASTASRYRAIRKGPGCGDGKDRGRSSRALPKTDVDRCPGSGRP